MYNSAQQLKTLSIARSSMEAIGLRLLSSRLVLKLSQTSMAEKLFVQPNSLCHWERGRNYPDRLAIIRLADNYGLTTDWIYRGVTIGIEADIALRLEMKYTQQLSCKE